MNNRINPLGPGLGDPKVTLIAEEKKKELKMYRELGKRNKKGGSKGTKSSKS